MNLLLCRDGARRKLLQTGTADTWRFVLGPDGQPANTGNGSSITGFSHLVMRRDPINTLIAVEQLMVYCSVASGFVCPLQAQEPLCRVSNIVQAALHLMRILTTAGSIAIHATVTVDNKLIIYEQV